MKTVILLLAASMLNTALASEKIHTKCEYRRGPNEITYRIYLGNEPYLARVDVEIYNVFDERAQYHQHTANYREYHLGDETFEFSGQIIHTRPFGKSELKHGELRTELKCDFAPAPEDV